MFHLTKLGPVIMVESCIVGVAVPVLNGRKLSMKQIFRIPQITKIELSGSNLFRIGAPNYKYALVILNTLVTALLFKVSLMVFFCTIEYSMGRDFSNNWV